MGKGKGKPGKATLKNALQSQQSRFKAKEKLSHAAQIAEQKNQKGGRKDAVDKGKGRAVPRQSTIPFKPTDRILLLGEGNFSYARALVFDPPTILQAFPPGNLTATAYDSEEECYEKYSDAQEVVEKLKEKGVEVLFNVDATRLERNSALKGRKWDKVVWNFPHAGKGITDQDRNILSNQTLILGFLRSASHMLSGGIIPSYMGPGKKQKKDEDASEDEKMDADVDEEDAQFAFIPQQEVAKTRGSVLITLRNVPPYTLWDVPRLAKKPPLPTGSAPKNPQYIQLRSFRFNRDVYKGYSHRMTKGERAHGTGKTGEGGEDRTWEFCLADKPVSREFRQEYN